MTNYWVSWEGTRFPVRNRETTVGRSPYCTIVLNDPSVSREHAAFRLVESQLVVVDLGSRNGTFVNGEAVKQPRNLQPGDVVILGTVPLQVMATEEDGRARNRTRGIGQTETPLPSPYSAETDTTTTTIDLVDTLLARARESSRRDAFVPTIRTSINNVLNRTDPDTLKMDAAEAARLAAAVRTIRSWTPDGSLDSWCTEVLRLLGATDNR